jgi:hypothetical protein
MAAVFITWAGGKIYPDGQYPLGDLFPVEGGKTYRVSAVFDYLAQGDDPPQSQLPGIRYNLALVMDGTPGPPIPGGTLSGGTRWAWVKGAVLGWFTSSRSSTNCQLLLVTKALDLNGTGTIANFKFWLEQVEG